MIRDGEHRPTRTRIAGSRPAPDKPRLFGLLTLSGTGTHPVYGELSGVTDDVTSQCATRVSSYLTASERCGAVDARSHHPQPRRVERGHCVGPTR
jgi:hypothetical protein